MNPQSKHLGAFAAAALLLGAAPAFADELPAFRKGMWEFDRTMEGQGAGGKPATLKSKQCTDPTADMKRSNEMLSNQGCRFTPVVRKGNAYSFSADCKMQGLAIQSQSVLTAAGDSAYTVQVTTTGAGAAGKELLKARRVGDC